MFFERVLTVCYARNPALGQAAVAVVDQSFRDDGDLARTGVRQCQGTGKSGQSAADYQMIELQFLFFCHFFRTFFHLRVLFFGLNK